MTLEGDESQAWHITAHEELLRLEQRAFDHEGSDKLEHMLQQVLNPDRLQQLLVDTETGDALHAIARYSDAYRPEGCSPELWMELLGKDVDDREHGALTAHLGADFIARDPVATPYEKHLFIIACWMHDLGEALTGDPAYQLGDRYDPLEASERLMIAHTLLWRGGQEQVHEHLQSKTLFREVQLLVERAEALIAGQYGSLSLGFNSVEKMGYLRTAARAGKVLENGPWSEQIDQIPTLRYSLSNLNIQVTLNHLPALMHRADFAQKEFDSDAIKRFLAAHEEDIEVALLNGLEKWGPDHINQKTQEVPLGDIAEAWDSFKADHLLQHA